MLRYLRLLGLFVRVSAAGDVAYRMDFLLSWVIALLQLGAELIGLWAIFSNTRSLAGWNAWQMLALMGVFRAMSGVIGMIIAPNMRLIMEDIRAGTLDFALLQPINAQFFISVRKVVLSRGADVIVGLGMAGVAAWHSTEAPGWAPVARFMMMLSCGVVIIYSFWLVLATLAFWLTRISNIEMVFWNIFEAGRYPVDIYRPWIRWILTVLVPLAFLTTFPAGMLVGKGGSSGLLWATGAAALSLTAAAAFWRFGVRHYSGASA